MKILIISSFFPYPLHAGGYVRLYNLIKQLAKRHEITLIAEKRSKQLATREDIQELEKFCKKVIVIPSNKQWSWQNIVKTGITPYPFLLTGHTSKEMKEAIIATLKEKTFDLIHVETFYIMQNLPKTYLPVVLAEHNIEYQVYRKYVATAPLPLRPFLLADIEKMKYWEKKFWKKASKLIAVSESDRSVMGRTDVVVVANGVDLQTFSFITAGKKWEQKEKRILFMGDFTWLQNREAANWILDKIWPAIVSRFAGDASLAHLKLWIVGKHIPQDLKAQHGGSIIIDEHAPNETEKIYKKSFILLAPIRVGGGTSYKILEAMASGVAVVTTELGANGLGAMHKKDALIGTTTEEFAEYVCTLVQEKDLYKRLTGNARKLIEEKYSWEHIALELEKVYQDTAHL